MYKIEGRFFINGLELRSNIDNGISQDLGNVLGLNSRSVVYIKEIVRESEYLFSDDKDGKVNSVTIIADEEGVAYFPLKQGLSPLILSGDYAIGLTELKD